MLSPSDVAFYREQGYLMVPDVLDASTLDGNGGARRPKMPLHASLGQEPLARGFTVAWLRSLLRRRPRAAIKVLLLDQRAIAGIGNIYAIEALWRARIHPLRKAGSLRADEIARLHEAIRWALRKGIRRQPAVLQRADDGKGQRIARDSNRADRLIGDVEGKSRCLTAGGCDLAYQFVELLLIAGSNGHGRAFLGQSKSAVPSDALRCAGDDEGHQSRLELETFRGCGARRRRRR